MLRRSEWKEGAFPLLRESARAEARGSFVLEDRNDLWRSAPERRWFYRDKWSVVSIWRLPCEAPYVSQCECSVLRNRRLIETDELKTE